ncbi:MAG: hypothetical protein ACHQX1_03465 [Candidatus Micrarchaeales archaeon]
MVFLAGLSIGFYGASKLDTDTTLGGIGMASGGFILIISDFTLGIVIKVRDKVKVWQRK